MRRQVAADFARDSYLNEPTSNVDVSISRLILLINDLIREVELLEREDLKLPEQFSSLGKGEGIDLSEEIKKFEIALIKGALYRTVGHHDSAAALLNLDSSALKAKISEYNINVDLNYLVNPRRALGH